MGILALKTLAKKLWSDGNKEKWKKAWYSPVETYEEARTALRWTLSRPVTACVCPSHAEFLWGMLEAEKEMQLLEPEDEGAVALSTEGIAPIFSRS